jgi:hypothetical protein
MGSDTASMLVAPPGTNQTAISCLHACKASALGLLLLLLLLAKFYPPAGFP